jgi:hypothetical protein
MVYNGLSIFEIAVLAKHPGMSCLEMGFDSAREGRNGIG